jgi:hypothetical protein
VRSRGEAKFTAVTHQQSPAAADQLVQPIDPVLGVRLPWADMAVDSQSLLTNIWAIGTEVGIGRVADDILIVGRREVPQRGIVKLSEVGAVANHISLMRHI